MTLGSIDIWAAGCTVWEMVRGENWILFRGDSNNDQLKKIQDIKGSVSNKMLKQTNLWGIHYDDVGGKPG